ncbi:ubiquitin carboxyl-terminal hydrolase 2-like [Tachypleus tridentatus]|uniref:ubiquitin carboxyl-terminal hydrolase 2-like n=1 Tax=Tachypleus tridentatus TaxID=6853 RepID=UPI003FD148ED
MPVPAVSTFRRSVSAGSSYPPSTSYYRSGSLDRTHTRTSYIFPYTTPSSSSISSYGTTLSSRPPRPMKFSSGHLELYSRTLDTHRTPSSFNVAASSSARSSPVRSLVYKRNNDYLTTTTLGKCYELNTDYCSDSGYSSRLSRGSSITDLNVSMSHLKIRNRASSPGEVSNQSSSSLDENGQPVRNFHYSSILSWPRSRGDLSGNSTDTGFSSVSSDYSTLSRRCRKSSLTDEESVEIAKPYASRSRDNLHKGGLVGLRNLGNTCFMNSVLQCLSHTKCLLDYCLRDNYTIDINTSTSSMKGVLMKSFSSLLQSMWKTSNFDTAVSPQHFHSQIQRFAPRFTGYRQQDAQEFLRYLLQGLHEDVNRVTTKPRPLTSDIDDCLSENQKSMEAWKRYLRYDDSKIVDMFVGQLRSSLKCTVCGYNSVTFDPFWDLSLPILKCGSRVTLQQCLELFTKEEKLDGDEKPYCSKCKTRQTCLKNFTIHKFPSILVLHLKRFSPSERFRAKLNTEVEFPMTGLDLGLYASKNSRVSHSTLYNLYAVCNHSGSTFSGHYTALCRHPYSDEWHEFNDSKVSKISTNCVICPEAYILFYEISRHSSHL